MSSLREPTTHSLSRTFRLQKYCTLLSAVPWAVVQDASVFRNRLDGDEHTTPLIFWPTLPLSNSWSLTHPVLYSTVRLLCANNTRIMSCVTIVQTIYKERTRNFECLHIKCRQHLVQPKVPFGACLTPTGLFHEKCETADERCVQNIVLLGVQATDSSQKGP